MKASRLITHNKRLANSAELLETFFARVRGLGDRLGPVLYQLPPAFERDDARLAAFLDLLPDDLTHVFEFRNESWWQADVYALLRAHQAAFCIYNLGQRTTPMIRTCDDVYVRFHGPHATFASAYSDAQLRRWATAACGARRRPHLGVLQQRRRRTRAEKRGPPQADRRAAAHGMSDCVGRALPRDDPRSCDIARAANFSAGKPLRDAKLGRDRRMTSEHREAVLVHRHGGIDRPAGQCVLRELFADVVPLLGGKHEQLIERRAEAGGVTGAHHERIALVLEYAVAVIGGDHRRAGRGEREPEQRIGLRRAAAETPGDDEGVGIAGKTRDCRIIEASIDGGGSTRDAAVRPVGSSPARHAGDEPQHIGTERREHFIGEPAELGAVVGPGDDSDGTTGRDVDEQPADSVERADAGLRR